MRIILIFVLTCVILQVSSKKYYLHNRVKVNWFVAFQDCLSRGQKLATIYSVQDQRDIEAVIKPANMKYTEFWTSGTDQGEEGVFVWMSTGDALNYFNWSEGEPNNSNETENCMHVTVKDTTTAKWNDNACFKQFYYICEDALCNELIWV